MLKYLRMGSKRTKAIWWILVVVTTFTFVGGFIFLFGSGLDSSYQAKATGALGTVNGSPITRADFQNAVAEQRQAYRQRFNSEPGDQETRMIEAQAWRGLINQRLLEKRALALGLTPHDREVVLILQAAPPNVLLSMPDFQTNGKFDPNKYAAALRNPGINWAPFEDLVRKQLPVRKLQERMVASIKLSQPELEDAYRQRFEKAVLTLVSVPPLVSAAVRPASEADMDRVYQAKKGLFSGPERTRLEVLTEPKRFAEDEVRAAREQAQSLVERARRGEDFAQLARDYSEGPAADKGGEIQRLFQPTEFGPELAPKMAAMQKGDIGDPIAEPGRFVVVKVLDRMQDPVSPTPNLRLAQIVVNVRPGEQTISIGWKTNVVLGVRARAGDDQVGRARQASRARQSSDGERVDHGSHLLLLLRRRAAPALRSTRGGRLGLQRESRSAELGDPDGSGVPGGAGGGSQAGGTRSQGGRGRAATSAGRVGGPPPGGAPQGGSDRPSGGSGSLAGAGCIRSGVVAHQGAGDGPAAARPARRRVSGSHWRGLRGAARQGDRADRDAERLAAVPRGQPRAPRLGRLRQAQGAGDQRHPVAQAERIPSRVGRVRAPRREDRRPAHALTEPGLPPGLLPLSRPASAPCPPAALRALSRR